MQKVLKKKELNNFIKELMSNYEIIAPVKNGKFEIIKDPSNMELGKITIVPAKEFFLPEGETLIEFKGKKVVKTHPENKKRIIFGMRKCDLNAVKIMDSIIKDENYLSRRKNTILMGIFCEHPDEYCFCNSMELEDYYDLFFYPEGDKYYISVGSEKGKKLVAKLPEAKKEIIRIIKNFKRVPDKSIEKHYRNKIWESDANRCLSCAACTINCPTCTCFEIYDELSPDLKNGTRKRGAASCQLRSFSTVAGGKAFRNSRLARFKQFVYHKIVYYKKRNGRYMCVGCGRCLRACPPKIDWTDTINILTGMKNHDAKRNRVSAKKV